MTPYQQYVAFHGILYKEVKRFLRIWPQTLLPSAISSTLYFMIFGQVIGTRVGLMDGVNYSVFIMPGLIMMAVITNAYSNVVGSFYGMRFSRAIEELLVSPTPNWIIVLGFAAGGITRGFSVGLIVWLIAAIFTGVHVQHVLLTLLTLILCSSAFALAGFLNAVFARNFDDTAIVPTFVLTPLIYLGGVFYSINNLPMVWQLVSKFNPIHYVIELFRYSMLGTTSSNHWPVLLMILIGLVAVLFSVCLWCMHKGKGIKT